MKIIVFAGGSGTRFWPLSRKKMPKQFQKIIGNESTFTRLLTSLATVYDINSIYVQTTEDLFGLVKKSYPSLPRHNIITEPSRRDVGPAVGLAMAKMRKLGDPKEPVAIIWSDCIIANTDNFFKALKTAEEFMLDDPNRIIFLGEEPAYPNENLGWIEKGEKIAEKNGLEVFERKSFTYRPPLEKAKEWFAAKTHLWNPGYFVTTPEFILNQYELHCPQLATEISKIENAINTDHENEVVQKVYPEIEAISFDDAILMKMDNKLAMVLAGNYEWADPGTLYALKQYLQESEESNVTKGNVLAFKSKDSLVYNSNEHQIVTTIGLDGFVVINTPDAVLVCHKDQIPEIKALLKEFEGSELERYL